ILWYDYCITFFLEVDAFWRRFSLSWVSALFVINRYVSLFSIMSLMLQYFGDLSEHVSQNQCMYMWHLLTALVGLCFFSLLLTIRTFALYNRNKWICALLFAVGMAAIAISVWIVVSDMTFVNTPKPDLPGRGCNTLNFAQQYFAGAWAGGLVFDTLVFALTTFRVIHSAITRRSNLYRLMLRDGTLYYGVMVITQAVNITVILVRTLNTISSVLIARLMLNLRDSSYQVSPGLSGRDTNGVQSLPTMQTIGFRPADATTHNATTISTDL
ncbi:hypothetical protein OBBRIDRAFT_739885, partial [Obba rivulosa]